MPHGTERWLPIPGYDGAYEASSLGRIRSVTRRVPAGPRAKTRISLGRVLQPALDIHGRRLVNPSADGRQAVRLVSHLVAEAFLGPRPPGHQVCHNNGDATDDRVENLRWDTASANILDQTRHGTHNNARKTHCIRGHDYAGDNLFTEPDGRRRCLTCLREQGRENQRRYRARRKAEIQGAR